MTNKLKPRNPLALKLGENAGKLPHELPQADMFVAWLIEQGMTREDYELTLESVKTYLQQITQYGYPIPTAKLTNDQAGWARADHLLHYNNPFAKWFIDSDKPSKPIPASYRLRRSRDIREDCDCAEEGIEDYAEWGTFHDGRTLYQCEECGEVIVESREEHDVATHG
jgi:hypothetical protein